MDEAMQPSRLTAPTVRARRSISTWILGVKVAHQRPKLLRQASQVLKDVKEVIHLRRRLILQKVILS
jgi:hypothetical protein